MKHPAKNVSQTKAFVPSPQIHRVLARSSVYWTLVFDLAVGSLPSLQKICFLIIWANLKAFLPNGVNVWKK